MKQEAEQFRQWKASREKELLQVPLPFPFYLSLFSNDLRFYFYLIFKLIQLRKEGRKSEYERHKLQALNQRQKMVGTRLLP